MSRGQYFCSLLGTYFEVGLGACGVYNVDTDHIVAVSEALFDSYPETSPGNPNTNAVCNRVITISCAYCIIKALFTVRTNKFADGGVTQQAIITDRCAGCAGWGDLDMSPSLFQTFAPEAVGRLYGVNWYFN
ncbi:hypothetical protein HWV62_27862 [Athelia sp. TMB]|nr:hypothetical protein HWV62_27862 [Athelia sp. TMB]